MVQLGENLEKAFKVVFAAVHHWMRTNGESFRSPVGESLECLKVDVRGDCVKVMNQMKKVFEELQV